MNAIIAAALFVLILVIIEALLLVLEGGKQAAVPVRVRRDE